METLDVLRRFITRGNASLDTVPPLDGAFLPNNLLETASAHPAGVVPEPDQVAIRSGSLVVSSGAKLLQGRPGQTSWETLAEFRGPITAFAALPTGWLVATTAGLHHVALDGSAIGDLPVPETARHCATDMCRLEDGSIVLAVGSAQNPAPDWHVDLMSKGATGSLWRAVEGEWDWRMLADGLAWPAGVAPDGRGGLVYTEAWKHAVNRLAPGAGRATTTLARNLPGYPGRIRPASNGGFWMAMFALRTHLVEFVLTQDDYRNAMMREIDPRYWVRPDFRTLNTGLVPLQGGGIKKLGQTKPWAPPRSYGLVVQLDSDGVALRSFHSRADGRHHGVTGVAEADGDLLVAARGADAVVVLEGVAR